MTRTFAIGLMAAALFASTAVEAAEMAAKVPFDFQVGSVAMTAGTYTISTSPTGQIVLRNETARKTIAALAYAGQRKRSATMGALVFNRYGNEYYLTKIWNAGSASGHVFRPGKREREVLARVRSFDTAAVALNSK